MYSTERGFCLGCGETGVRGLLVNQKSTTTNAGADVGFMGLPEKFYDCRPSLSTWAKLIRKGKASITGPLQNPPVESHAEMGFARAYYSEHDQSPI